MSSIATCAPATDSMSDMVYLPTLELPDDKPALPVLAAGKMDAMQAVDADCCTGKGENIARQVGG